MSNSRVSCSTIKPRVSANMLFIRVSESRAKIADSGSIMPDLFSCSMVNRLFAGTVNLNDPMLLTVNALLRVLLPTLFLIASTVAENAVSSVLSNLIFLFATVETVNALAIFAVALLFLTASVATVNALLIVALPSLVIRPLALTVNAISKCASALSYG